VIGGTSDSGEDGTEGVRCREVYATCLHGPALPEYPWLTGHLMFRALRHRDRDMGYSRSPASLVDHAEADAHAAALRLACRSGRRSGAAAVAVGSQAPTMGWGQAGRDGLPRHGAQPVSRGTGWNSR
jgi:hypothetical protein